jgi:DNA polymerase III delta prime subunit
MAFEAVRGQDIAVKMLVHELENDRVPQTLLFHGPDGSGKFLTALQLVKELNCTRKTSPVLGSKAGNGSKAVKGSKAVNGSKAGFGAGCECASCRRLDQLISRDLFLIVKSNLKNTFLLWNQYGVKPAHVREFIRDLKRVLVSLAGEQKLQKASERIQSFLQQPGLRDGTLASKKVEEVIDLVLSVLPALEGSTVGIDSIREVQRYLSLKSSGAEVRAVIIDGAERMTMEASNCFLKILEDTPANALIILTTAHREQIRSTILSRCRSYRFRPLGNESWDALVQSRYGATEASHTPESKAVPLFERLLQDDMDLLTLTDCVRETAEGESAIGFLDRLVEKLRGRIPALEKKSINAVQEIEVLLKRVEFVRSSILNRHVNTATALHDLLLGDLTAMKKYIV